MPSGDIQAQLDELRSQIEDLTSTFDAVGAEGKEGRMGPGGGGAGGAAEIPQIELSELRGQIEDLRNERGQSGEEGSEGKEPPTAEVNANGESATINSYEVTPEGEATQAAGKGALKPGEYKNGEGGAAPYKKKFSETKDCLVTATIEANVTSKGTVGQAAFAAKITVGGKSFTQTFFPMQVGVPSEVAEFEIHFHLPITVLVPAGQELVVEIINNEGANTGKVAPVNYIELN